LVAQHRRELDGVAEVGAVGADHRKVLRSAEEDAFYEWQNHLEMEQVQRPEPPVFRVRSFDHGEGAARFQHARDQGGQTSPVPAIRS
jgi:hypothetical protein